jgi:hypothetical protein
MPKRDAGRDTPIFFKGAAMARAKVQHKDLQFLGDSPDWRARAWRLEKTVLRVVQRGQDRHPCAGGRNYRTGPLSAA